LESLRESIEERMVAMVEESLAPPFMEVARRLRPSFICGSCSCLEEGALEEGTLIVGRSCSGQIALRTVSVER
jgi:hypothetical protein